MWLFNKCSFHFFIVSFTLMFVSLFYCLLIIWLKPSLSLSLCFIYICLIFPKHSSLLNWFIMANDWQNLLFTRLDTCFSCKSRNTRTKQTKTRTLERQKRSNPARLIMWCRRVEYVYPCNRCDPIISVTLFMTLCFLLMFQFVFLSFCFGFF